MVSGLPGFRGSLAVLEMALQPTGSVTGAAAYQRGYQYLVCRTWQSSDPQPVLAPSAEQFMNDLWSTAVERMEAQARAAKADGVIGVSVDQRPLDNRGWQLTLNGTGVRVDGLEPPPRPFLTGLQMSEFMALLLGGWVPAGLVWGNAAVHVHGFAASPYWQGVRLSNAEMQGPTDGVNAARTRAQMAAHAKVQSLSAQGAVAMSMQINRETMACQGNTGSKTPGMLITAHTMGTAIVRYRDPVVSISTGRQLSGRVGA